MSIASLPPSTSTKSSYLPPPPVQMHTLPLPNTAQALFRHSGHASEHTQTPDESSFRRKSVSPPIALAPIEMNGQPPLPPMHYGSCSQSFNSYSQSSHSQRYHYPNEDDTLAGNYDQRRPSHQALPNSNPHQSTPSPARSSLYHPYYASHHPPQHRTQPYSSPHPHSVASGASPPTSALHQPPSPQSPDGSFPNSAFYSQHPYESHHILQSEEKRRTTPPISPTHPLSSATSSSEAVSPSLHSSLTPSLSAAPSVAARVSGASRSGSISSSERISTIPAVESPVVTPLLTTSPLLHHHPAHSPSETTLGAPLSLHDRRERNKAASAKYRAKKHVQSSEMRQQIQVLQDQNNLLSRQLEESRTENISLKTLVEKLKSRIVAQKVLKRLRQVGRDRASPASSTTTSATATSSGAARKHSRNAKASSRKSAAAGSRAVAVTALDDSLESTLEDDSSHDSEIDELEDALLAQNDDDDDFDLDSQMSDESEYDNLHSKRKRQRRSSNTVTPTTKSATVNAPLTPRRSSASSTASTASSSSSSSKITAVWISPIVPDIHYE